MPRPPNMDSQYGLTERQVRNHPCEGGCGTVLPPSTLRFCAPCRREQDIPRHTQFKGRRGTKKITA